MTIVAAGGGSGGHVTPSLAVLHELKRHDPNLTAYFITDRGYAHQAASVMAKAPFPIKMKRIFAGKLRRYYNVAWWRQLFDFKTIAKNIRDLFLVGVGFLQSLLFLRRVKPDVVFAKGGFVCLPVGLAAKVLGIPLVIHDSDAQPGLTNKLLAKYATVIGTGAPVELYPYPKGRTHYVGIPVDRAFRVLTPKEQQQCKAKLGLHDTKKPLLVVTGGGLGARNLNRAVVTIANQLLEHVAILHLTGQANYQETLQAAPEHIDYIIKPFVPGLESVLGAADVVVTRAGATAMAELAAMEKAVVLVPHPHLAGGHQLKNAQMYEKLGAAIVLQEEEIILDQRKLLRQLLKLIGDPTERISLGKRLRVFSKPHAALDMAALIAEAACTKQTRVQ